MRTEYIAEIKDYTLLELHNMSLKNEIVVGTVIKYLPEEGLLLSLGNDLEGKLSIDCFEDSLTISQTSLITRVGTKLMCYVDSVKDNTIYLNRAKLQKNYKDTELNNLPIGTIFDTQIISIANFGIFVDMGYGVIGLLPIGDISIARFSNLRDVFKIGSDIKVIYKGCNSKGYLVSHKELLGTWEENLADFTLGGVYQGIVREVTPFGAFIELSPNLTGLADLPKNFEIHIGDSISVLLKSYNTEKLKVKLHIISISPMPYILKYSYKIQNGVLKEWFYTPKNSIKVIKSIFK